MTVTSDAATPAGAEPSGHVDPFCRAALPPRALWPELRFDRLPALAYPASLVSAVLFGSEIGFIRS